MALLCSLLSAFVGACESVSIMADSLCDVRDLFVGRLDFDLACSRPVRGLPVLG